MEKIAIQFSGLGVAGLVLAVMLGTSGYAGSAALTASLALLGGPFGMLGGAALLLLLTAAVPIVAMVGVDKLAKEIIQALVKSGKSKKNIRKEIEKFPVISEEMKKKIIGYI